MANILTTSGITKRYKKKTVVDNLSLEVEKGAIFGLLGPNGSGKTTTLSILLDVIPADSGSFQWFEKKPSHISRKKIGAIIETPNFIGYLSAQKNLEIVATIKEIAYSDIERVLRLVNLFGRKDDPFKTFSLGMKQRLAIAAALLGKPEVLLLDEPTNGLDPKGIVEIRNLIMSIAKEGVTIIIASHVLDEIEKVCTHVAIIKNGILLTQGSVDRILGDECILELKASDMNHLAMALQKYSVRSEIRQEQDMYIVKFYSLVRNNELNEYLVGEGVVLTHLSQRKKKLELQFLEITK